jgi:hypothetical protein
VSRPWRNERTLSIVTRSFELVARGAMMIGSSSSPR